MNILIISQYFHPENFRINDLAVKLCRRGHQITVVTGIPNYPEGKIYKGYPKFTIRKEYLEGIEIIHVPIIPRLKSRGLNLVMNYLSFLVSASFLGPVVLRRRKFDIILSASYSPATANIPAVIIKALKNIPLVIWMQDLWPQSLSATGAIKSPLILKIVTAMMNWIYKKCDLVLVQSEAFIRPISDISDVKNKIKFFPNWAEDNFRPLPKSNKYSLPHGFNVMFAGNLGQAQSLEVITQAAEVLRNEDINWIILGEGRKSDWLRAEIINKNLSHCVYQMGRRPVEEMPTYFAHADAMLVTLGSDPIIGTTIPGKIQSYLACGRPIIGALNGEGAKIIRNSRAGVAVPSGDARRLAEAVQLIASYSNAERDTLGANGLQFYKQNFSSDLLIPVLEKELSSLIEDRQ